MYQNAAKSLIFAPEMGQLGFFESKTAATIDQIELQPRLADMGQRSIALNHLEEQMTMHELDLKKHLMFSERTRQI